MSLLKTKQIAQILQVSVQTARKLVRTGVIPSYFVGKQRRVDSGQLVKYLKQSEQSEAKS